jgi:hypothetical protein
MQLEFINASNIAEVRRYLMEHDPNDPPVFPGDLARQFQNVLVAHNQAVELYRLNPLNRDHHVRAGRLNTRVNRLAFELGIQLQRLAHIHQNPELQHNGYQMETDPGYVRWRQVEAEHRLHSGHTWRHRRMLQQAIENHEGISPQQLADARLEAVEIQNVLIDEEAAARQENAAERLWFNERARVGGVPREHGPLNFLPLPSMPILAGRQGAWRPEGFRGVAPGSGG